MQLQKGTDSADALNKGKLKLVNDVLLYYNFLYKDQEETLAEDPSSGTNRISRDGKVEDIM